MSENTDVTKRLDVLIRLLLEQQIQDGKMQRHEQLVILDSVGLTPGDIGKILGQKSKDISSQLIRIKKKKTGKIKNEQKN